MHMSFDFPIISADSYVTEPPECYAAHIHPAYRDCAPRMITDPVRGDVFVIPGMKHSVPMGLVAAAGKPASELSRDGVAFDELHRSGYDATLRVVDQQLDGVSAEVLYPSVGLVLCNHPDANYKHACFVAYNRWLAKFCSQAPDRLLGCGQLALRSVDEGVTDLVRITEAGLRGVMMPGVPAIELDYDDPSWDPFWEAAVGCGLPLSFHVYSTPSCWSATGLNGFLSATHSVQDILGTLVLGGVFERHPALRIVCAGADAGWVPHYLYRMDHAYRHRRLQSHSPLKRLPSEYFAKNIYVAFHGDATAFTHANDMNWRHLMWENGFPHADSTWPTSIESLTEQTTRLRPEQTRAILSANTAELYGIDVNSLTPTTV